MAQADVFESVSNLGCINVVDEIQWLLEDLTHVKLQLLNGTHILDPELCTCL